LINQLLFFFFSGVRLLNILNSFSISNPNPNRNNLHKNPISQKSKNGLPKEKNNDDDDDDDGGVGGCSKGVNL
jgi:hypothetical protein